MKVSVNTTVKGTQVFVPVNNLLPESKSTFPSVFCNNGQKPFSIPALVSKILSFPTVVEGTVVGKSFRAEMGGHLPVPCPSHKHHSSAASEAQPRDRSLFCGPGSTAPHTPGFTPVPQLPLQVLSHLLRITKQFWPRQTSTVLCHPVGCNSTFSNMA